MLFRSVNVPDDVTPPVVYFDLLREVEGGTLEHVENSLKQVDPATNTVTWEKMEEFDEDGKEYIYSVREVDKDGNYDYDTPKGYTKVEKGLTVTNYYIKEEMVNFTATVTWEKAPKEKEYPAFLQLYQDGVKYQERKAVNSTIVWLDLPKYDEDNREYVYTVKEEAEDGRPYDEAYSEYHVTIYTGTNMAMIYNRYVEPGLIYFTAQKEWIGLEDASKPSIWFKLIRYYIDDSGIVREDVGIQPVYDDEATWYDLPTETENGEVYSYYVQEVDEDGNDYVPEGFMKIEKGDSVTNIRIGAKEDIVAEKVWEGDKEEDRPRVWLKLYRMFETQEQGMIHEEVDVNHLEVDSSGKVVWKDQPLTTEGGKSYIYYVKEVDEKGNDFTPPGYQKVEYGLKVTNKRDTDIKLEDITFKKIWKDVPSDITVPEVWFQLHWSVWKIEADGSRTLIDTKSSPELKKLEEANNWTVTWKNMPDKSPEGYVYKYFIREVDASGREFSRLDYKSYDLDSRTRVNQYNLKDVTATKKWVGGSGKRPTIWLKLMYSLDEKGTNLEEVIDVPIKELKDGQTTVTWEKMYIERGGKPLYYHVIEVDKDGKDFVPEGYVKEEKGLEVTNTWKDPGKKEPDKKEPDKKEPDKKDPAKLPATGDQGLRLLYLGLGLLAFGVFLTRKKIQVDQ